jgi:hypothetical protein
VGENVWWVVLFLVPDEVAKFLTENKLGVGGIDRLR